MRVPLLLIMRVPAHYRSWDLNKICYKSGVPLIENGMIERVSTLGRPQVLAEALYEADAPRVGVLGGLQRVYILGAGLM